MDTILRTTLAAGLLAAAALAPASAQEQRAVREAPTSFNAMASDNLPAVVAVQTTAKEGGASSTSEPRLPKGLQDFMERFFGEDFSDQLPQERRNR